MIVLPPGLCRSTIAAFFTYSLCHVAWKVWSYSGENVLCITCVLGFVVVLEGVLNCILLAIATLLSSHSYTLLLMLGGLVLFSGLTGLYHGAVYSGTESDTFCVLHILGTSCLGQCSYTFTIFAIGKLLSSMLVDFVAVLGWPIHS